MDDGRPGGRGLVSFGIACTEGVGGVPSGTNPIGGEPVE